MAPAHETRLGDFGADEEMKRKMAIAIAALWAGSLICGWLREPIWLIVPPLFFAIYTIWSNMRLARKLLGGERGRGEFYRLVVPATIKVILWNGALNAAIFGVAWLVRSYIA